MDKQWYVVNTYSGHENKVKEKLEMRAESMGMQDYIYRVVVPMDLLDLVVRELNLLLYNLMKLIKSLIVWVFLEWM